MCYVNYFLTIGIEKDLPLYVVGVGVGHNQEPKHETIGAEEMRLHITLSGCGAAYTDDGKRRILPVGTMLYTPAHCPLSIEPVNGGWRNNWVMIHINNDTGQISLLGDKNRVFAPDNAGRINQLYEKINHEITKYTVEGRLMAAAVAYEMLCLVISGLDEIGGSLAEHSIFSKAVNYIENNFDKPIRLETLCRICRGISAQYLCRVFRMMCGMRPTEYIQHRRIEYAKQQLANTEQTIYEIAVRSGFESESYFYRCWKRFERESPAQYRRTHLNIYV